MGLFGSVAEGDLKAAVAGADVVLELHDRVHVSFGPVRDHFVVSGIRKKASELVVLVSTDELSWRFLDGVDLCCLAFEKPRVVGRAHKKQQAGVPGESKMYSKA